MGKNNLKELLEYVKTASAEDYPKLINQVEYLKQERIKFVGNDLRNFLNLSSRNIEKENIMNTVAWINDIAKKVNYDFCIPTSWEDIEKYLRFTILEDLGDEFKKQGN